MCGYLANIWAQVETHMGKLAPMYRHLIAWSSSHATANIPPMIMKPMAKQLNNNETCRGASVLLKRRTISGAAAPKQPYRNLCKLQFFTIYLNSSSRYWRKPWGKTLTKNGNTNSAVSMTANRGLTLVFATEGVEAQCSLAWDICCT